jgi:hypothetical protein
LVLFRVLLAAGLAATVDVLEAPAGAVLLGAYSSILRWNARKHDSLRRLENPPNSGLPELMFISLEN